MASVGVRDLRANLAEWLGRAAAGESVVVTDRGRPVARLLPAESEDRLASLVEAGVVVRAREAKRRLPAPVATVGAVSDLVGDQRR